MRSIIDMDTVQIEITNSCRRSCSNCSRFCGHSEPFFMTFEKFKEAVDSMVGFPKMTGIQGGEPLLHPLFPKFCEYLKSKIPTTQLGLWSTFPKGYEDYRNIIVETFHHVFINDHTRSDIYHHPVLVATQEIVLDKGLMWRFIDHCWVQESWSASIFPNGAWFCEIAGSMSQLFGEGDGWKVEPGWWWRIPADFKEQMEMFCPRCGFPTKLKRRSSQDNIDDISVGNFELLKDKSKKIEKGLYKIYDIKIEGSDFIDLPLANYKDTDYRNTIASRYGIVLAENNEKFWTPYLLKRWKKGDENPYRSLFDVYTEKWMKKGENK